MIDSTYDYEVGEKTGAIPYRVYSVPRQDRIIDGETAERLGLSVTSSILAAEGRRAIVLLGGPAKPDMISLDSAGKLWLTEVKGTFKGTALSRAGLLRSVIGNPDDPRAQLPDPLTGKVKVWENSPEWLRRSGADVLRNLKAMEEAAADQSAKSAVRELMLRYAEAVSAGFEPTSHMTEMFQVGSSSIGESLPYLDASPALHAYCAEVEPERITQVEVESPE